jgi:hypothetical protein
VAEPTERARSRRFGTAYRQYLFVPVQRTRFQSFGWRVGRRREPSLLPVSPASFAIVTG